MKRPDICPADSELGLKAPNGLTPPSTCLFRRSGWAVALLILAAVLAPGNEAQAQAEACTARNAGDVRLRNGNTANEGLLEICADKPGDSEGQVWGTICDDYWTTDDAHVACRQLGYTHAQSGAFALLRSHFGTGPGPIMLDDMLCEGNEASLLDCMTARGSLGRDVIGVHNCKITENVGIRCLNAAKDASLERLSVHDANGALPLEPPFTHGHDSYSVSVAYVTSTVTVYATPAQDDATVEYLDSNDMSLGTGNGVVVPNLVVGSTVVKVKVTSSDTTTEMIHTVTINRAAQANNPATGQPEIAGTLRVRETLTASKGTIADADGLTNASYAYQWIRVDGSNSETDIPNASGSTYDLSSADQGNRIRVKASFDDDRGNGEMRTSAVTGTVQAEVVNPPPPPDDPVVTLVLTPDSIGENGDVSTVTATVSPASTVAFTVTVSAQANSPAVSGDFTLTGTTLSFGANATDSTGSVTITANNNGEDEPNKTLTVSGTVTVSGVEAPADVTLTITDDDEPALPPPPPPDDPAVTLVLTPDSIGENGDVSTVTATVSPASTVAFTVTVSAQANSPAVSGDFTLTGTTLSFAPNATDSTGSVTITANNNDEDAPNKTVTVSGAVSVSGVEAPPNATLTITDDDEATQINSRGNQPPPNDLEKPPVDPNPVDPPGQISVDPPVDPPVVKSPPVVTLVISPDVNVEDGGVSMVTATALPASSEAFRVTVSAYAVAPAVAGDFELQGTTLSFAPNATQSTGTVMIAAVDNQVDEPDKTVAVSGTVSLSDADAPANVMLTITDDEPPPVVTLVLSPDAIGENGGVSTITATASPASSQAFTVTVSADAVSPAVAGDYELAGTTLSFAANATRSTGTVTITAMDNHVDAPGKMVAVSGTVPLSTADAPDGVVLTIVDDESSPVVTLSLSPGSISESGGVSTVTATASPASWQAFSVTVSADAVSPAVAGDVELEGTTLNFAANATRSTGEVTITAVGNMMDAPDKAVTVSGRVSASGIDAPADVTLIITDDDEPPPDLSVADATGRESDGRLVFEVSLNAPSSVPVTVDYATADGTARAGADYVASWGTLTLATGVTRARIEVAVLPDALNEEDESFTLSLSNVSGAILTDGQATGWISGGDQQATAQWLARFGRTVTDHVVGAVEDQLRTERGGEQLTVAGQNLLGAGAGGTTNSQLLLGSSGAGGFGSVNGFGRGAFGMVALEPGPGTFSPNAPGARRMTARDLLSSSALRLNAGSFGLGTLSFWGRGAYSRFDGSDDDLTMQGEVVSATVGVDYGCGRCLYGVALSHSSADGSFGFSGSDLASVTSELTGLYPYYGYRVTKRLWVWGLAGYGVGEMTSVPESGAQPETVDLTSRLAAVGARGELLSGPGGFSLALKADALIVKTQSDEVDGLIESEGDARRIRVGLEGSHVASFENNSSLRSHLDVGLRGDGGDADEGFGFEISGGLDWYGLVPGLSFNVGARGLVAHGADEFSEWGYSGGLRYDPTPASPQGLIVGLKRSWGAPLSGGLQDAMWNDSPLRQAANGGFLQQQTLNAEVAYGFDAPGGVGVPWARAGLFGPDKEYRFGYRMITRYGIPSLEWGESPYGRDYRLGWEHDFNCRAQVTVELIHSEGIRDAGPDTGIMLRVRSLMRPSGSPACGSALQPNLLKP